MAELDYYNNDILLGHAFEKKKEKKSIHSPVIPPLEQDGDQLTLFQEPVPRTITSLILCNHTQNRQQRLFLLFPS